MCGVTNCPLAFRETLALRQIVGELTEGNTRDGLSLRLDAGRLLYDVCVAIGLDPWSVLSPAVVSRILCEDARYLWPTLTEAEDAEMVELDNVREPYIPDTIRPVTEERRINEYEMWRGPRPF
jgi:hypothetical protein